MPGHQINDHQMRLFRVARQTDTVVAAAARASTSRATGQRIACDPRLPVDTPGSPCASSGAPV